MRSFLASCAAGALMLAALPGTARADTSSVTFQMGPAPAPLVQQHAFYDAAAAAPNDIWAVGAQGILSTKNRYFETAAVEHFDGTKWSGIQVPGWLPGFSTASHVSATDPHNVWVTGGTGSSGSGGWIDQWDGSAWHVRDSGANKDPYSQILAVPGGEAFDWGSIYLRLWNGSSWQDLSAGFDGEDLFSGFAARSANNAWLFLYDKMNHWDGSTWTNVPYPTLPTGYRNPGFVLGPTGDLWGIATDYTHSRLLHYSDGTWATYPLPDYTNYGDLHVDSNDMPWALNSNQQSIVAFNGSTLAPVTLPPELTGTYNISAIAIPPGTSTIWAVGTLGTGLFSIHN